MPHTCMYSAHSKLQLPHTSAHCQSNVCVLNHSPGTVVDVFEAIWSEVHSPVPPGHHHYCIAHIH